MQVTSDGRPCVVLNNRVLFCSAAATLVSPTDTDDGCMLSAHENILLKYFVSHPYIVISRRQLVATLQGCTAGAPESPEKLDGLMSALRRAIGHIDSSRAYFRHVPRIGYAMLAEVRAPTAHETAIIADSAAPARHC